MTGREHHLLPLLRGTLYLPYATALRMGRFGYQNSAQKQLGIHYNNIDGYLEGLQKAVKTAYAPFSRLGLNDAQGEPIQIEVDGAVGGCEPDEPHQRANRDESEDHESHRPDAPAETLGDERAEGQNDGPEEEHLPLHRHRPQVHERTRHRTVFCEVIRGHVNEAPVLGVGE